MTTVNISKAKRRLSALVKSIENEEESEVIITRFGRPIARLIPLEPTVDVSARIGIAKNNFSIPDDIDANNAEVATLILGTDEWELAVVDSLNAELTASKPINRKPFLLATIELKFDQFSEHIAGILTSFIGCRNA